MITSEHANFSILRLHLNNEKKCQRQSSNLIVQLEAKVPRFTLSSEVQTHLFPELQSFPLPSVHGPVFLATAEAWKTLQSSSSHPVNLHGSDKFSVQQSKSPFAGHKGQPEQIHSWIFVPSYHRSQDSDPHQMRIDWADAVSHNSQYVRIVVVRAETQEVQVW